MRGDELWRRVGPPLPFTHIIVIKQRHLTDGFQIMFPLLHPGMRRWRARSGREKKEGFHRCKSGILPECTSSSLLSLCFNDCTRRSRKGVWAAFNLRLASSSEKKQT